MKMASPLQRVRSGGEKVKAGPKNVLYLDLSTYLNPSMVLGSKCEPEYKYFSQPDYLYPTLQSVQRWRMFQNES